MRGDDIGNYCVDYAMRNKYGVVYFVMFYFLKRSNYVCRK